MANEKILVIDDDPDIVNILKVYIENEGYRFYSASNYQEAQKYTKIGIDLVLLDVVMPEMGGFDMCLELRKVLTAPIIFLSCKSEEMDKIIGLSVGADDYIAKPFLPGELMARIKSNIRRAKMYTSERYATLLCLGDFQLDMINREVMVQGRPVPLLPKEYDILLLFARNPNRLFTKEEIFQFVWKDQSFDSDLNTIMVHISNLRKKMGASDNAPRIITVKGVGYKLAVKSI